MSDGECPNNMKNYESFLEDASQIDDALRCKDDIA